VLFVGPSREAATEKALLDEAYATLAGTGKHVLGSEIGYGCGDHDGENEKCDSAI